MVALALHFDPRPGVSPAALLAALLDAGLSPDDLRAELATLGLPGWELVCARADDGVPGRRVALRAAADRLTVAAARDLVARSELAPAARATIGRVLDRLAAPSIAPDTLLGVAAVAIGLVALAASEVWTAEPPDDADPAALALLAALATVRPPALRLRRFGYGSAEGEPPELSPTARVWLGESERPAERPSGALILVADHADEVGPDYARLAALAANWAGVPAHLCAFAGAREGAGPPRAPAAIEAAADAGARRLVVLRLGLAADPAIEDGLAGIVRWARGRWRDCDVDLARPLLVGRQLAARLAERIAEAHGRGDEGGTAFLLIAPGSAEAEANADAYRLARLAWEDRPWPWFEVAFAAHAAPTIADALDRLGRLGARRVVAAPLLPLPGPAYDAIAAALAAAGAARPELATAFADPVGAADDLAIRAWERYRQANGQEPTGPVRPTHRHGPGGGHAPPPDFRPLLPPRYQGDAPVERAPMAAADLVYGADGWVDWDAIWGDFCDLAVAGGPPHRGDLLEPPDRAAALADPTGQGRVLDELARGLRAITGWPVIRDAAPGWIGLVCPDESAAVWLLRAILTENIAARREGLTLFLPAGPHFRLAHEIKNVITAVAKTHHYWTEHLAALVEAAGATVAPRG